MTLDRRKARLSRAMTEEGLDVLLLYGNAWISDFLRYATGFAPLEGESFAVATRDGEVTLYLDNELEAERAEVEVPGLTVVHAPNMLAELETVLGRQGNRRIGAGPYKLIPHGLVSRKDELRLVDETAFLDRLMMMKMDEEIDTIRRAAVLADEGYIVFRDAARPGRFDYELIAEIEAFFRAKGVEDNFQIIGVGGTEVRGMAPPTGKRLKRGDLVTTELSPCVDGYYGQICRTLVLGEPSAEQTEAMALYREAMEAGIATVRPGVTAADIARAENDVFRRQGYGDYVTSEYTRVRGHGLGLFLDTKPQILEDVTIPIEEGMTLVIHPNTYHPKVGYMVLGDAVAVTRDGCQVLTQTERKLFSVPG
jgi:Xaa-Pro aminopeptidase